MDIAFKLLQQFHFKKANKTNNISLTSRFRNQCKVAEHDGSSSDTWDEKQKKKNRLQKLNIYTIEHKDKTKISTITQKIIF